jgi:hypothetical protein
MTGPHQHADLDRLADVLATEADQGGGPPDISGCEPCAAALAELRSALPAVARDLGALPELPPVPAALERSVAPATAPGATTVLPDASVTSLDSERRTQRWLLPVAGLAAAAVVVVGGGLLLTHNATDSSSNATRAAAPSTFPISQTGTHYNKASLPTAIPALLKAKRTSVGAAELAPNGQAGIKAPADPLALLRTPTGLASCLAGLSDPSDTGVPLALDYASWGTRPAMVVVLPASRASKVDVFVVGANCTHQESDLIYYLRADRPAG